MLSNSNDLKLKKNQSGFTLIEVLVGILMATAFVLITSQAIALSAVFRVRAQRESEAINWVQEDLENIKFVALLPFTASCDDAVESTGYGQALINQVNTAVPLVSTRELLNKSYTMTRTLDVTGETFNVMAVSYSVVNPDGNGVIADLYTEVIPDAAFDCE